jgi:hypothetical protein
MKMTPEEDSVYMKAFEASKAKTVKERMTEAESALAKHREGGAMRAVDQGIKDADSMYKLKNRKGRLDAAIEGKSSK